MSVAFDAVSNAAGHTASSATSLTYAHTCGASANLLIVGAGAGGFDPGWSISSVTYNGVAMTALSSPVHSNNDTFGFGQAFYLMNPPTGAAYNVVVTLTGGTANVLISGAVSYSGADIPTSVSTAFGPTTPVSNSVTVAAGQMAGHFGVSGGAFTGESHTQRWRRNVNTFDEANNAEYQDTSTTGSPVALTLTNNTHFWAGIGFLIPAQTVFPVSGTAAIVSGATGTVVPDPPVAAPAGWFDPDMVPLAWFNPDMLAVGWFDQEYVDNAPASNAVSGTAAVVSGATGTANAQVGVSGTAAVVSGATGTPTALHPVDGTAAVVSGASGAINAAVPLSGTAAVVSGASGAINAAVPLSSSAPVVSGSTGTATAQVGVSGSAPVVSDSSGTVGVIGGATQYPVSGTAAIVSGSTGAVTTLAAASGTAAVVSGASGAPTALHPLSSSAPVVSGSTGDVVRQAPATGTAAITSGASGAVSVIRALSGQVDIVSTATGQPLGLFSLSGAAAATSNTSGLIALLAGVSGTATVLSGSFGTIKVGPLEDVVWVSLGEVSQATVQILEAGRALSVTEVVGTPTGTTEQPRTLVATEIGGQRVSASERG